MGIQKQKIRKEEYIPVSTGMTEKYGNKDGSNKLALYIIGRLANLVSCI